MSVPVDGAASVAGPLGQGLSNRVVWGIQGTICLLALLSVFWLTPFGMAATGDSVSYIGAARNVANGRGISRPTGGGQVKPLTHFPPLYPLTLAVFEAAGIDSRDAARWLGAALFSANVLLIGVSIRAATGSRIGSLVGSVLSLVSPTMIGVHVWILSEPLYLILLLSALLLLGRFARTGGTGALILGAVLVGLAYLTRYVGSALLATALVVILWGGRQDWRRRLRQAAVFVGLSFGPMLAWMVRNLIVAGTATNRILTWHPMPLSYLKRPFSVVWEWLMPFEFTYTALYGMVVVTALLAALAAYRWVAGRKVGVQSRPSTLEAPHLMVLHVVHFAVYVLLLGVSLTFLDASTPIDARTTSPLFVSFVILVVGGGVWAWRTSQRSSAWRPILVALPVLVLVSYLYQDFGLVRRLREDGLGMASRWVRESPTIRALQDLPPETVLYTNEPERVYYISGRGAYMIPVKIDAVTGLANLDYGQKLESMRAHLLSGEAVLVLFRTIESRPDLASVEEMAGGLRVLFAGSDGQSLAAPSFPAR